MGEGFRRAGITFDLAIDKDEHAVASYERNHGHRPLQMDVNDFARMVRAGWRPAEQVDFFLADPPCTPHSRAGKRLGLEDERDCMVVTAELIALLRPRAYLIGNVPGLQDSTSWHIVQDVIGGLSAHGYCVVDYAALDAADYGSIHLCQRHVAYVGKLSDPTTGLGSVAITRHGAAGSRTEPAAAAGPGWARTTPAVAAGGATPAGSGNHGGRARKGSATETGRAGAPSTERPGTSSSASEVGSDTSASTGSSPPSTSDVLSLQERSSTTATRLETTTDRKTSSHSRPTASTCDTTSKAVSEMDAEVAGCPDCRWYATPQHRIRPFWFGHLDGPCLIWPARTHGSPEEAARPTLPGFKGLRPWVTCRQALGHLPLEELGRPVRMRIRDKGEDGTRHGGDKSRCSEPDRPAKTVVAKADRKGGQILIPTASQATPGKKRWLPNGGDESLCSAPDKPAATVGAHEGIKGGQVLIAQTDGHPAARPDAPSPTIRSGDAGHSPPQTVLLRVGAGPGDRPATTILGDERLSVPGHHDAKVGNSSHKGPNAVVLSARAAAILQGFPDGECTGMTGRCVEAGCRPGEVCPVCGDVRRWHFTGATKKAVWSQLGQAMPPGLAEPVARSVADQMRAARGEKAA
jgi:site-specific DNA-cytosine methylase